jgi:hypothetical protein
MNFYKRTLFKEQNFRNNLSFTVGVRSTAVRQKVIEREKERKRGREELAICKVVNHSKFAFFSFHNFSSLPLHNQVQKTLKFPKIYFDRFG